MERANRDIHQQLEEGFWFNRHHRPRLTVQVHGSQQRVKDIIQFLRCSVFQQRANGFEHRGSRLQVGILRRL